MKSLKSYLTSWVSRRESHKKRRWTVSTLTFISLGLLAARCCFADTDLLAGQFEAKVEPNIGPTSTAMEILYAVEFITAIITGISSKSWWAFFGVIIVCIGVDIGWVVVTHGH